MPDHKRRELAAILFEAGVPLIEDDVYGELAFNSPRPKAVKAFERDGGVLLCSSFSKTLAVGYRVGWVPAGRFTDRIERLKNSSFVAAPSPTQMAVAALLENGGFDRHLRRLRRTYKELSLRMICALGEHFPAGTRVTRPQGGHILWVELPPQVDALELYEVALENRICVAPGPMFSSSDHYDHHIRLNSGIPWTAELEAAISKLGELASLLAAS
jgi:DNA-binding transcriptional MocR family regulator